MSTFAVSGERTVCATATGFVKSSNPVGFTVPAASALLADSTISTASISLPGSALPARCALSTSSTMVAGTMPFALYHVKEYPTHKQKHTDDNDDIRNVIHA